MPVDKTRTISFQFEDTATRAYTTIIFQNASQKYLKFLGRVILNPVLMKIRIVSGSHQMGPMGEMLKQGSA